jgi:hypothetical protein
MSRRAKSNVSQSDEVGHSNELLGAAEALE